MTKLYEWWSHFSSQGPKFGYCSNANKTWPVTKGKHLVAATAFFADTGVQITSESRPYLGVSVGTEAFVFSHVEDRVAKWEEELECLATIALTHPHSANAAFTYGLSSRWSYLTHTVNCIAPLLEPLEAIRRSKLIPALTGQPPPYDNM